MTRIAKAENLTAEELQINLSFIRCICYWPQQYKAASSMSLDNTIFDYFTLIYFRQYETTTKATAQRRRKKASTKANFFYNKPNFLKFCINGYWLNIKLFVRQN